MDSGLSWADQWDYNTDAPPPPSQEGKQKGSSSKEKSWKKKLSFKWIKQLCKKSSKN
uniref:Uncharacterized protein n=1 Tax=Kalanchoe fedtschenkoi TaxID=63787 RepID=A0A7N0VAM4_KALFE